LTQPIVVRHFRRVPITRCILAVCVCLSTRLNGQTGVQLTAGITSSGVLVNDGVVHVRLQPALAPTIGLALAMPTGQGPYRVRFEAHASRATLNAIPAEGASDNLGTLTTIDALVMAEGPLNGNLRWQVGGGAIFYQPGDNQGVFRDGPVRRWLVAGGVIYTQPLTPRYHLVVNGRVDAHSFLTTTLQARNYAGSQGVRRFALTIGVERVL
jgi:hypothetical protein